jgi:hypothetical protein
MTRWGEGWWGVDFDGTIVEHGTWVPIPAMVARVRTWLEDGREVRIVTARAGGPDGPEKSQAILAIQRWCEGFLGQRLEVTDRKDYMMVELWDDRAVQVETNTGRTAVVAALQSVLDDLPVVADGLTPERLLTQIHVDVGLKLMVAQGIVDGL